MRGKFYIKNLYIDFKLNILYNTKYIIGIYERNNGLGLRKTKNFFRKNIDIVYGKTFQFSDQILSVSVIGSHLKEIIDALFYLEILKQENESFLQVIQDGEPIMNIEAKDKGEKMQKVYIETVQKLQDFLQNGNNTSFHTIETIRNIVGILKIYDQYISHFNFRVIAGKCRNDFKTGIITQEEFSDRIEKTSIPKETKNILERINFLNKQNELQFYLNFPNQENILQDKSQLGKDISDGGGNIKGVFIIDENYVARNPTSRTYIGNKLIALKDKIQSPNIKKTVQICDIDNEIYQIQERAYGENVWNFSGETLQKIPQKHYENFWDALYELEKLGYTCDISGRKANILYNPQRGFEFIDLTPGRANVSSIEKDFFQGIEKAKKPKSM